MEIELVGEEEVTIRFGFFTSSLISFVLILCYLFPFFVLVDLDGEFISISFGVGIKIKVHHLTNYKYGYAIMKV